jgi:hypothetical protein
VEIEDQLTFHNVKCLPSFLSHHPLPPPVLRSCSLASVLPLLLEVVHSRSDGVSLNVTCLVCASTILSFSVKSENPSSYVPVPLDRDLECLGDGIKALSVPPSVASRTYACGCLDALLPRLFGGLLKMAPWPAAALVLRGVAAPSEPELRG